MSARFWLEKPDTKRLLAFGASVAAIVAFWLFIREEIVWLRRPGRFFAAPSDFVALMFGSWIFGWFCLLFVRAEDLRLSVDYPFERAVKVASVVAIVLAVGLAILIAAAFRR